MENNNYVSFMLYQNNSKVKCFFVHGDTVGGSYYTPEDDAEFDGFGKFNDDVFNTIVDMSEELKENKPGEIKKYDRFKDGYIVKIFDSNSDWNEVKEAIKIFLNQDKECYDFDIFSTLLFDNWANLLKLKNAPVCLYDIIAILDNILNKIDFFQSNRVFLPLENIDELTDEQVKAHAESLMDISKRLEGIDLDGITLGESIVIDRAKRFYFTATVVRYLANSNDFDDDYRSLFCSIEEYE